jgi:hypothetical protein
LIYRATTATSWTHIVPGKFSSSIYGGFLFYCQATGLLLVTATNGQGRLSQLAAYNGSTTWTHIIPGFFGPSGFTGLLFYDSATGYAEFYDTDGQGHLIFLNAFTGWRTTWTIIVPGMYVPSPGSDSPQTLPSVLSDYTGLFFYSPSEGYGEFWSTDGNGNIAFIQGIPDLTTTWTHIVAGNFVAHDVNPYGPGTFSDLFFYDAVAGHGEMYKSIGTGLQPYPVVVADGLPPATNVVAGNFGSFGLADLLFHVRSTGELSIMSFNDGGSLSLWEAFSKSSIGIGTSVDLVIPGPYWMANNEDHWFEDGPGASNPTATRDWRAGPGQFSSLALYDATHGQLAFYLHEPKPPLNADGTPEKLSGYITSTTSHGGTARVSTGSVLPGETIYFHVSSQVGPYTITIYPSTAVGTTALAHVGGLPTNPTPFPIGRTAYRDGAKWPAIGSLQIPNWPSGLYVARVAACGIFCQSDHILDLPFVVRSPRPGSQSNILVVLADTTYAAYNDWGGRSVYGWPHDLSGQLATWTFPQTPAHVPFAFHVSFDRPHLGRINHYGKYRYWEMPFIQWLAQQGFAVEICTARDLHFAAPSASNYSLMLFVGHHEYWTYNMRVNTQGFAAAGGNVAFFSGNVSWWQVRLSNNGTQMTCYKIKEFDPFHNTSAFTQVTTNWWDEPNWPETSLTGVSYWPNSVYVSLQEFTVRQHDHWVFTGAPGVVSNGSLFGYFNNRQSSVVNPQSETDRFQSGSVPDIDGNTHPSLVSPPGFISLASVYVDGNTNDEKGTMGIFSPSSGLSWVFTAATNDWAIGLSLDNSTWTAMDQITHNVINTGSGRAAPLKLDRK